jgi:hypothetical protein
MTEKKSKNPFINMANEAKKNKSVPTTELGIDTEVAKKAPKPTKGFGGPSMVRRSGRGS